MRYYLLPIIYLPVEKLEEEHMDEYTVVTIFVVTAPIVARSEGYFPPELLSGEFSVKSDVYSYGVVSDFVIV